jgi:hypothetical protein
VPGLIVQRARIEKRAGATLSTATMSTLQEVLDLIAEADDCVDTAQAVLSELMGVPNPDDNLADDDSTAEEESLSAPEGPDPAAVRERLRLKALAGK